MNKQLTAEQFESVVVAVANQDISLDFYGFLDVDKDEEYYCNGIKSIELFDGAYVACAYYGGGEAKLYSLGEYTPLEISEMIVRDFGEDGLVVMDEIDYNKYMI